MHALPVSRVQMVGQEGVLRDTHHLHVSQYCRSEPHPVLVFRVLCGRVCVHVRVHGANFLSHLSPLDSHSLALTASDFSLSACVLVRPPSNEERVCHAVTVSCALWGCAQAQILIVAISVNLCLSCDSIRLRISSCLCVF